MNSYTRPIENKEQNLAVGSPTGVLKSTTDFENFDREIPYTFLRKKAEKLSTATYLVTGFLSDSEPIKWQIRECGLGILSDIISVSNPPMSEMAHRVKSVASGVGKITSLFEIAAAAGFISGMNLAVLKEEYLSLTQTIENRKIGKPEGGYVFSREFFSAPEPTPILALATEKEKPTPGFFSQGHQKTAMEKDVEKDSDVDPESNKGPYRKTEHATLQTASLADSISKNTSPKKEGKSSRREIIISLIRDKGDHAEVSIKDVIGQFSDCGEKTVQRELTALVEEGVLKKTGERRWSRYSLNI